MGYKSKEKFLEKSGKRWSFCHVDPSEGVPCKLHVNHKYPLGSPQQQWVDPYFVKYFENVGSLRSDLVDYWGEDIVYRNVEDKNFGITDRTMIVGDVVLTQVVAVNDFTVDSDEGTNSGVVHRGELGGFIEKPEGLIDGWLGDNAYVYGDSIINGGLYIYDSNVYDSTLDGHGSVTYSKIVNSVLNGDLKVNFCDVADSELKDLHESNKMFLNNRSKSLI